MIVARDRIRQVLVDVGVLGEDRHEGEGVVAGRAEGPEPLHVRDCHNSNSVAERAGAGCEDAASFNESSSVYLRRAIRVEFGAAQFPRGRNLLRRANIRLRDPDLRPGAFYLPLVPLRESLVHTLTVHPGAHAPITALRFHAATSP